ncbi:MAG: carbamoyltransferase [Candidatus Omnitrophota bacterium]
MKILGISCFYHDAACAIVVDGKLVAAAEEERFSRKKHDNGFPERAIRFCLEDAGLLPEEIDYVVFYEKPFLKFDRILKSCLETYPRSYTFFREAMIHWLFDKLWIKSLIEEKVGVPPEKILFTQHHLSHAASAFLCSPFEKAAILTVDGVGEWNTATIGKGEGNRISLLYEMNFPHSVGLLYSVFTAFLGFEVNEGEYKVMGMAPYGKPVYEDKIRQILKIYEDGSIWLDPRYFCHHYGTKPFNDLFVKLFGKPRDPRTSDALEQPYADLAASIQKVTEEIMVKMARYAHQVTGVKKMCLAGGVALNTVANWKILEETPIEELFVQPAAGDSGGALGAALDIASLLGEPRNFVLEHAYWGRSVTDEEISRFLEGEKIPSWRAPDEEALVSRVVDCLQRGEVVGWMQGRFEWGPRALGNRSILADPRRAEMKDIVNRKIKFREPFRPFSPSVLSDRVEEYFEFQGRKGGYPTRFMLLVPPVKMEKRAEIPAVTHIDGTGRLQAVVKNENPLYYRLIERFGEETGVPVVLNTSFNLKGEPIVAGPQDAYSTFLRSEMDILVMGSYLVEKEKRKLNGT